MWRGVTGCTLLPHGKIAFANEMESSIIVVKADGLLDFKIDLKPFAPVDITYISKTNTIAVTARRSIDIKFVDVKTKRVLKTYSLDSPCSGITYTDERLMLCNKTGIHELNQHDGSVKKIVSVNITSNAYVVVRGDKIYYTHLDNNSVTCCDFQGHIQWIFQFRENLPIRCNCRY
ncbi:unnamed protein product [Mytilus edulis]|uniref:Uncharacterized protein n=1 Tax=Mytilus edulis TaxID=6550 RepID=A0A8S3RZB9_MYTED|nr:unnamed protein product [Mytilus edulis]